MVERVDCRGSVRPGHRLGAGADARAEWMANHYARRARPPGEDRGITGRKEQAARVAFAGSIATNAAD
jgi:hypothetical protein